MLDGLRAILRTIEQENQEGSGEDHQLISLMQQLQLPAPLPVAVASAAQSAGSVAANASQSLLNEVENRLPQVAGPSHPGPADYVPETSLPANAQSSLAEPISAGPTIAAQTSVQSAKPEPLIAGSTKSHASAATPSVATPSAATPALDEDSSKTDPDALVKRKTTGPAASDSTLRVDVILLNRMMNLVGELVLTRNQILQGPPPAIPI